MMIWIFLAFGFWMFRIFLIAFEPLVVFAKHAYTSATVSGSSRRVRQTGAGVTLAGCIRSGMALAGHIHSRGAAAQAGKPGVPGSFFELE